jgi:hypothetical protein
MDERVKESKREYRRKLAALPIVEKLRILGRFREREEMIGQKLTSASSKWRVMSVVSPRIENPGLGSLLGSALRAKWR